jgi:hypothetical protein
MSSHRVQCCHLSSGCFIPFVRRSENENILQQYVTTQAGRKKDRTSEYEKTESVLLEWFRQKWATYIYMHTTLKFIVEMED